MQLHTVQHTVYAITLSCSRLCAAHALLDLFLHNSRFQLRRYLQAAHSECWIIPPRLAIIPVFHQLL
jgi:hypothetical protein